MIEKIKETTLFIQNKYATRPQFGVILGTGLGALAHEIESELELNYDEIPHFPLSTVESHHGKLIFGKLGGRQIVAMQGRFHYYEGYTMQQITFPVRVMKWLGVEKLFISNAAGGLNPAQKVSDLMIINDHINLLPENPLRGKNYEEFGHRFPDMSDAYDQSMISQALEIARQHQIKVHTGVYASVSGPNLETEAEYKFLRIIGADAVGMSTIPENIVARQMGIPCFAVSVITDMGIPGQIKKVDIADILSAAAQAEPGMTLIIKELIRQQ
ncbi:MAG: purine-nucleoside phosphorylase [Candidatus Cyclobacteriaceae bacterium M3_2C_046]